MNQGATTRSGVFCYSTGSSTGGPPGGATSTTTARGGVASGGKGSSHFAMATRILAQLLPEGACSLSGDEVKGGRGSGTEGTVNPSRGAAPNSGAEERSEVPPPPVSSMKPIPAEQQQPPPRPLEGHSILSVLRPHLASVSSDVLLRWLELRLPPLRLRTAASQHSYDMDLTRCYYSLRCAVHVVETLEKQEPKHHLPCSPPTVVGGAAGGGGPAGNREVPRGTGGLGGPGTAGIPPRACFRRAPGESKLVEGCLRELHALLSSIERTHLKVHVLAQIASLCFLVEEGGG